MSKVAGVLAELTRRYTAVHGDAVEVSYRSGTITVNLRSFALAPPSFTAVVPTVVTLATHDLSEVELNEGEFEDDGFR